MCLLVKWMIYAEYIQMSYANINVVVDNVFSIYQSLNTHNMSEWWLLMMGKYANEFVLKIILPLISFAFYTLTRCSTPLYSTELSWTELMSFCCAEVSPLLYAVAYTSYRWLNEWSDGNGMAGGLWINYFVN